LTISCKERKLPVDSWKLAEAKAMDERGESLGIFDIKHEKAPTLAQITLKLTDTHDGNNNGVDMVDWIANGIKTENDQWVLNLTILIYSFAYNF
jgi:hypothetical protein